MGRIFLAWVSCQWHIDQERKHHIFREYEWPIGGVFRKTLGTLFYCVICFVFIADASLVWKEPRSARGSTSSMTSASLRLKL